MDDPIYIAFLFAVDKNLATVGIGGSECTRLLPDDPSIDIRTPSALRREVCNVMLEGLDCGLPPVCTWQDLYRWLGRGHGWAYFTNDSGNQILPHWFGVTEYRCRQNNAQGYRSGPFIDLDVFPNGMVRLAAQSEMTGPDAELTGKTAYSFEQLGDNFIITKRPIFEI